MTSEVTSLSLAVDSSQVKSASGVLDGMAAAGGRAETAATALEASARKAGTAATGLASAAKQAAAGVSASATAAKALEQSQKGVADALRETATSAKASVAQVEAVTRAQAASAAAAARAETAQTGLAAATARLAASQAAYAKASSSTTATQEQIAAAAARVQSAQASVAAATLRASSSQTAAAKAAEVHKQALASLGNQQKLTANQAQQLSFQLNDFFVQVASGGSPLTALIQQGSQLSGTFGGLGGAFRAITSLVTPLSVAITGVVAAVAGFGLAAAATERWQRSLGDLRAQLTATGRAGLGDEISKLIQQLALAPGVTRDAAIGIVSELSKVNEIGASLFGNLAKLSADFARATGTDAETAAKTLAKAFADPAQGAKALEGALGTLSSSTLLTVERLTNLGDRAGAQRVLLDALRQAVGGLASDTTPLQKSINDLGNAWDSTMGKLRESDGLKQANTALAGFIGYLADAINKLPEFEAKAAKATKFLPTPRNVVRFFGGAFGIGGGSNAGDAPAPASAPSAPTAAPAGVVASATSAIDDQIKAALKLGDSYRSTGERITELVSKQNALRAGLVTATAAYGANSDQANRLRGAIAGIGEQLESLRKKGDTGVSKALLEANIQAIENALQRQTTAYTVAESILEATRRASLVGEQDYYRAKISLIQLEADAQVRALQEQNAFRAQQKLSGKEAIEQQKLIAANESKIADIRDKAAGATSVLAIEQASALEKIARGYKEAEAAAQSFLDTIARQNDRELSGLGRGNQQREIDSRRNQRDDQFQQRRDSLESQRRANQITTEQFDRLLAIEADAHRRALAEDDRYFARKLELQRNFGLGVSEALENYLAESRNIYQQAADLFSNVFRGAEDSLTSFLTTGKGGFREFVNSISADIVRIGVRQTIAQALEFGKQGLGGTTLGGFLGIGAASSGSAADAGSAIKQAGAAPALTEVSVAAKSASQALQAIASAVPSRTIVGTPLPPSGERSIQDLFRDAEGDQPAIQTSEAADALTSSLADTRTTAQAFSDVLAPTGVLLGILGKAGGAAGQALSILPAIISLISTSATASSAGSSGGGFISAVAGFFGFGGGKARGGSVSPGSIYEVNEGGAPELLKANGRTFLLPGEAGQVQPMQSGGSTTVQNISVNVTPPPGMSRGTANQLGNDIGRSIKVATSRNG